MDDSLANSTQEDSEVEEEESTDKKVKRSSSSAPDTISKKRRTSVYETAANASASGMISLGDSIRESQLLPQVTRFDQCLDVLNTMKMDKSISSKEYFGIVKAFMREEHYSALFIGMSADLRMEWLIEEGLIMVQLLDY